MARGDRIIPDDVLREAARVNYMSQRGGYELIWSRLATSYRAELMGAEDDPAAHVIAGWARRDAFREAAAQARDMADNEPDGYYGQACYEVARAIESMAARG